VDNYDSLVIFCHIAQLNTAAICIPHQSLEAVVLPNNPQLQPEQRSSELSRSRFDRQELDRLLTRAETSDFLAVSVPTLERWAAEGSGPECIKIGARKVGYPVRGLLKFLDERRGQRAA
jgi:predicted DNA-binding transcriptional regulator AlpA